MFPFINKREMIIQIENESGVTMGKLVRDRIPEIIRNDGDKPIFVCSM